MDSNYDRLLSSLTKAKEEDLIILLHRGVSKKFAFEKVKLDFEKNSILQFSEKLFFYGEKAKYFWNKHINHSMETFEFSINDVSGKFFKYIFDEFENLIKEHKLNRTKYYFQRNKSAISFFQNRANAELFIQSIEKKDNATKIFIRNYYLTILHQLGESSYKENSQFLSSTIEESVANKFAKNEIVISFWELNFNKKNVIPVSDNIPLFKGKPYKNQKEISLFTVVLPQFIHSFKFEKNVYINPAVEKITDFEKVIFGGLDINQDKIHEKLKSETNYSSGIDTDGLTYKQFK